MADQALAQSATVGVSRGDRSVSVAKDHSRLKRFVRKVMITDLVGLFRDAAVIISARSGRKLLPALWELCCIYVLALVRYKGPVRISGMKVHCLNFGSFLWAYREIFVQRTYLFNPARPSPRIFDCGANIGLATIFFKSLWPDSSVISIEPDPTTFATLSLNLMTNHLRGVQALNVAAWDSESEIDFYVAPEAPGSLLMSAIRGRLEGERIRVPTKRLSSLVGNERVDLLKLDVEGAEQMVLEDLSASGKLPLIDAIIAEFHHRIGGEKSRLSEFLSILEQSGFEYQLHALWNPGRSKAVVQDVLLYAERDRGPH